MAVDGYDWGTTRDWGPQSYDEIFADTLRAFRTLAPRRPVMIAETAGAPGPGKARWVKATLDAARADRVGAVVWFEFAKETDWRLSASPRVARAAREVVNTAAWRQGGDLEAVEAAVTPPRRTTLSPRGRR
jgi:hypothetical protein